MTFFQDFSNISVPSNKNLDVAVYGDAYQERNWKKLIYKIHYATDTLYAYRLSPYINSVKRTI